MVLAGLFLLQGVHSQCCGGASPPRPDVTGSCTAHGQRPPTLPGLAKRVAGPHVGHFSQQGCSGRTAAGCVLAITGLWPGHLMLSCMFSDPVMGPRAWAVLASGECTSNSCPPIRGTTWKAVNFSTPVTNNANVGALLTCAHALLSCLPRTSLVLGNPWGQRSQQHVTSVRTGFAAICLCA